MFFGGILQKSGPWLISWLEVKEMLNHLTEADIPVYNPEVLPLMLSLINNKKNRLRTLLTREKPVCSFSVWGTGEPSFLAHPGWKDPNTGPTGAMPARG